MDSANKILAKLLADQRKRIGLSQDELADRAAVHRTYVSQLERGIKSPTLNVLFRLADALGLPASRIVKQIEERAR